MNNERKIEILEQMRELIEREKECCFCPSYAQVVYGSADLYRNVTPEILAEIGLIKPHKMYNPANSTWYAMCDKQIRIDKINEAINKFKENKTMKFKVGDKVKIVRKYDGNSVGWCSDMDIMVNDGETYTIEDFTPRGNVEFKEMSWVFAKESLELVSLPINITFNNKYEHQAVQQFLFDNGCKWHLTKDKSIKDYGNYAIMVDCEKGISNLMSVDVSGEYRSDPTYTIADLDTIKEILNYKNPISTIQLNSEHTAEINKDTKTVKVGCQTFTFDKVKELAKVIIENSKQIGG